jgi:2-polyprenyl-3-methyl-5-hydroxy-6-metoxy-1,4-benzoquinol methylase
MVVREEINMSETNPSDSATLDRDAFTERMMRDILGLANIFTQYLGLRLGLYQSLVDGGPSTSAELAARTGMHERYVREWLEQQTVTEVLAVDDETLSAAQRRYSLSAVRAEVLLNRESPYYMGAIPIVLVGAVKPIAAVREAFRSGAGVPFAEYGQDLREGSAEINRPNFLNNLAQEWLPAMPDVHARLQADPPTRVADLGCGFGWSCIAMALGYPRIQVDGLDLDEPSIQRARELAAEHGLAERISFQVRNAGDPALAGQYDLVTAFECIHDMSDPVSALRSMRRLAKVDGTVLVVDERTGDRFGAENFAAETILYTSSVLHCLPVGMTGPNPAGTGALIRPDILRRYALEAGFREMEILPVENPSFRLYRLYQ